MQFGLVAGTAFGMYMSQNHPEVCMQAAMAKGTTAALHGHRYLTR